MQFELLTLFFIIVIVLVIGILANIGGFGGGIILIPILHLLFGIPLKIVIGTVLSSLFLPALFGVILASRRNEINYKVGLIIEAPTVVGVFIGNAISNFFSEFQLKVTFGIVALSVAILMLRKSIHYSKETDSTKKPFWYGITQLPPMLHEKADTYEYSVSIPFAIMAGLFIGILAGLLGVAGGWLKAPMMVIGFSIPPVIASGTALFMILITSFTGGILKIVGSDWDLQLFLVLTLTLSAGSIIGDRFKSRMNAQQISLVLSVLLLVVSIFTLIDAFV